MGKSQLHLQISSKSTRAYTSFLFRDASTSRSYPNAKTQNLQVGLLGIVV